MRAHRSLFVGAVLATLSILAITIWQTKGCGRSPDPDSASTQVDQLSGDRSDRSGADLFLRKKRESDASFEEQRERMVRSQLANRDISDAQVLLAMRTVKRHFFVPPDQIQAAYADHPVPIGNRQTISQPYIVALMTQLARPNADSVALDVGTGSGYQAAVLSKICKSVYSIEIVRPLADSARSRLAELGYDNVEVRHGDGYRGWPEHAPFDLIIVAAAPDHVPQPLIDQLKSKGRLVIPVGDRRQSLLLIEKQIDGTIRRENVAPVAFVPMTGDGVSHRD